jgi:hypothetical protein
MHRNTNKRIALYYTIISRYTSFEKFIQKVRISV